MKPVVMFGAGDQAELAHFYLTEDAGRRVAAFTVDGSHLREDSFRGAPIVPFERVAELYPPSDHDFFVAVGYSRINELRSRKVQEAREKGYHLISYVSSRATIWRGLETGYNCFILEDNTIQPFVSIGNNVTLWSGNHIGHHSLIEDDCFLASQIVVSGRVVIGQGTFIGVNATLRDHIRVGRQCVIGAGAVLLQDAPDFSVYRATPTERAGVPSTRLRGI